MICIFAVRHLVHCEPAQMASGELWLQCLLVGAIVLFRMTHNTNWLLCLTCLIDRVKDKSLIEDAFNVNPVYLKHENEGKIPDYRVIQLCHLIAFLIKLLMIGWFALLAALANSAWKTIPFTQDVVCFSQLWSEGTARPHSKGKVRITEISL